MGWGNSQFLYHFYFGGGSTQTLSDIGLETEIRRRAGTVAIDRPGGFKDQIRDAARSAGSGPVEINFERGYDFKPVVYSLGDVTLRGIFSGSATAQGEAIAVSGTVSVDFEDRFTDPLDVIEAIYGSSTSPDAPDWLADAANLGGTPYDILGAWAEPFSDAVSV